jgi:Cys-Gly metallodipeptidase DUG1
VFGQAVWGVEPDYVREGGSIGVAITFADYFGNDNVMLLPMGRGDDSQHSPNEKLDKANYYGGSKVMAHYLWELGHGSSTGSVKGGDHHSAK